MHLLEPHTFVSQAQKAGDITYLAPVGVASAFDAAQHASLIKTLDQAGTGTYIWRYLRHWLDSLSSRVRPLSPNGRLRSAQRRISRGLPRGGVVSPLLWIIDVNPLLTTAEEGSRMGGWKVHT